MLSQSFLIGGIEVEVFGLEKLPRFSSSGLAVLFLLHGREESKQQMRQTALDAIARCNKTSAADRLPLLCVTFDARNHGARTLDATRNASIDKNPNHALDMTACIVGTSQDVSLLIDFLPAALFPQGEQVISRFAIAGWSLGGHIAWATAGRDIRLEYVCSMGGSPSLRSLFANRGVTLSPPLATILRHTDTDALPLLLWQDRKVLVVWADEDTVVPFQTSAAEFVEQLASVASVQTYSQQGVGHTLTDEMRTRFIEWLEGVLCKES